LLGRLLDGYNEMQNTTDIKKKEFRKRKSKLKETPFLAQFIFIYPIISHAG
jgi:hypothetical protein